MPPTAMPDSDDPWLPPMGGVDPWIWFDRRALRICLVVNRDGRPAVHDVGVAVAFLLMNALAAVGVAAVWFVVPQALSFKVCLLLPLAFALMTGDAVRRGLRLPAERLRVIA